MNPQALFVSVLIGICTTASGWAEASERTAPFTAAELETIYAANIAKRAENILTLLDLKDDAKAKRVQDAIVAQYRSLRARDEAMDEMFAALSKNAPGIETNRGAILKVLSKQLHGQFLMRLQSDLAPEQIEVVKDRMTYNRLKTAYESYCTLLPKLAENEKVKILEVLKTAREEAMDGGTADEKAAIFERYKLQVDATLQAAGTMSPRHELSGTHVRREPPKPNSAPPPHERTCR